MDKQSQNAIECMIGLLELQAEDSKNMSDQMYFLISPLQEITESVISTKEADNP